MREQLLCDGSAFFSGLVHPSRMTTRLAHIHVNKTDQFFDAAKYSAWTGPRGSGKWQCTSLSVVSLVFVEASCRGSIDGEGCF